MNDAKVSLQCCHIFEKYDIILKKTKNRDRYEEMLLFLYNKLSNPHCEVQVSIYFMYDSLIIYTTERRSKFNSIILSMYVLYYIY